MVNTTQLQENIFKQIDWSRYNFSKSEWDDYGASGCLSVNDMDNIMPYKKGSSQYISEDLKRGDNIRLYS